jgi:hypothetical protein
MKFPSTAIWEPAGNTLPPFAVENNSRFTSIAN